MKHYLIAAILIWATPSFGQESHDAHQRTNPSIPTSMSMEDVAELTAGRGWGLAKPAELNGVAGPTHVLLLAEQLELTPAQRDRIEPIRVAMQEDAIALGKRLIELELALDQHFRAGTVTDEILKASLADIAQTLAALRYVHLSAHLTTPTILTAAQLAAYSELRGYTH
jgi:Spy/CpxP family protein refolding chaperone